MVVVFVAVVVVVVVVVGVVVVGDDPRVGSQARPNDLISVLPSAASLSPFYDWLLPFRPEPTDRASERPSG